jgi:uncharacterized protein
MFAEITELSPSQTSSFLVLRESDLLHICAVIEHIPAIETAYIFGSRGRGTARPSSDVDIAIVGGNASQETARRLRITLDEELPLPYTFDVVHLDSLTNAQLRSNILRDGKVIFRRVPRARTTSEYVIPTHF